MIADGSFDNSASHKSEGIGSRGTQQIIMARPAGTGSETGQAVPIQALLSSLRRRWKVAIPLGLCLAVAGATLGWIAFVPKYTASAYLRLNANERQLIFATADQSGGDFKLYKNTQQQLMKTPFVLNAALRDEKVASLPELQKEADPMSWLQGAVSVSYPQDGEIMQVSFTTASQSSCTEIVNAIVNAFMDEVVLHERNQRLQRRDSLERVYAEAESKVRDRRGELKTMASALGTSDSDSLTVVQQSALQQFGLMQEKLATIQFELMQVEGELKIAEEIDLQLKARLSQAQAEAQAEGMQSAPVREKSPDVMRLEEEVTVLRLRARMLGMTGPGHPSALRLRQELEVKETLLRDRQAEADKIAEQNEEHEKLNPSVKQLPSGVKPGYDLVTLTVRSEILKNQEKILQEKVDQLADETRQLGRSSIDVELLRSEITGLEDVLQRVGGELERTSIELKTASRISLISPAGNATSPDPKKRLTKAVALALLGLLGPLGLLIMWDLSRKKVDSEEAVTRTISLSNLGTIPIVPGEPLDLDGANAGSRGRSKRAELAESVDSLASMLLHRAEAENMQVIMISSAVAGEGKSTVACQLSASLARTGKRVVLVDFDLRRSSIHHYLKLQPGPGVTEVLQRKLSWSEALQHTAVENLCVLTAGEPTTNLREAAHSGEIDAFLNELRASFEIVIVDACPILPVVDARLLGKLCDAVILTLVRDISRLPLATKACAILKSYGIRVLGTVVIGCKSGAYSKYYDYSNEQREVPRLS